MKRNEIKITESKKKDPDVRAYERKLFYFLQYKYGIYLHLHSNCWSDIFAIYECGIYIVVDGSFLV